MSDFTVHISNLVERQFPDFYQENGPMFIAFVKAYYEWMESVNNPLYLSRKYYDNKEIDATAAEFLVYFKNKYLNNIRFDTQADIRQLIKHSLDIYRSKGTEQELKLLFNLVFGKDLRVYYPSFDLARTSDGEWYIPTYLELNLSDNNLLLNNKEVKGIESNATAYIESIVRKKFGTSLCDIAYISNVRGEFQRGEKIYPTDDSVDITSCPYFIGCVNDVTLPSTGVGSGYSNGDVVDIVGSHGVGGKAKVTSTMTQSGYVNFELEDGGYGYTVNSTVYISNAIISVSNVHVTNPTLTYYSYFMDEITQPKVYLNYENANGILTAGQNVYTYDGSNNIVGEGVILSKTAFSTSSGTLLCSEVSGSLDNTFYTYSNTVTADLTLANGYTSAYATGNFLANTVNAIVTVSNISGNFVDQEYFVQIYGKGKISAVYNETLYLDEIDGMIVDGIQGTGSFSGATANVDSTMIKMGLINTSGSFYSSTNSYVYGNNFEGVILNADTVGSGAQFTISPTLLYEETVSLANNSGLPSLNTVINATSYGFPGNPTANLTSGTIESCFEYFSANVGKLKDIIITGSGSDYINPPMYLVEEPLITSLNLQDIVLEVTFNGQYFTVGELITQIDARGIVKEISNNVVYVQRLRIDQADDFVITSNSATTITGSLSGATANIVAVSADTTSAVTGRNASVLSTIVPGNGIINSISIIDSGFNYNQGEPVKTQYGEVLGNVVLTKQGKAQGYNRSLGTQPSGSKKLFDGEYYQNYSYEIISSVLLNKYKEMVKQIAHVSGTKMFGKLAWDSQVSINMSMDSDISVS